MPIAEFKKIIPKSEHHKLMQWWNALGSALQSELEDFYLKGDAVATLVQNINAELAEREERHMAVQEIINLDGYDFPNPDYYENLIGNDIYLCLRGPTFHICKAHPDLRLMLLLGILPKNFSCYLDKDDCAMTENLHCNNSGYWALQSSQVDTIRIL
ncbi:hypothetical protein UNDYM_4461 [Undibacterium sp. YM2]|nr:hypothetical protein UNDYM_4461 [Undibacterium sp. YM2]